MRGWVADWAVPRQVQLVEERMVLRAQMAVGAVGEPQGLHGQRHCELPVLLGTVRGHWLVVPWVVGGSALHTDRGRSLGRLLMRCGEEQKLVAVAVAAVAVVAVVAELAR